jgi:hypothetical protein
MMGFDFPERNWDQIEKCMTGILESLNALDPYAQDRACFAHAIAEALERKWGADGAANMTSRVNAMLKLTEIFKKRSAQ